MRNAALLFLAAASAFSQSSSTIFLSNGVQLELAANLGDPTGQEKLTVEVARATGDSFYRIFWDQNHLAVFAYELQVSLTNGGDSLNAVAKPCEDDFAARYPEADAGKPVPSLSSQHPLGPLNSGNSATLALFKIPGMGLQVSDTIRVKMGQNAGSGSIHFAGLRVYSGGVEISGTPPPNSVAGRYAMFYLPDRGGFFFSTEPVTGYPFVATGTVDHARMRFTAENVDYECVASSTISSAVQVWVYHDPGYKPQGNWTQDPKSAPPGTEDFFTAASDSLGWWLAPGQ